MKTDAHIKKLIIEIHDHRKSTDNLFTKIEELGQKLDADEPVSSKEFFKLAREFLDKHRELKCKEDEVFEFFQNTPFIKTDDPILRQKLKDTQNEYRELYKDKPYERVDSEGFINDDEWNYWIDEITYKIQGRPWSDLLYQVVSKVDPQDFGKRGAQLEALILSENIPVQYDALFKDIKLSYQFGLFKSVLIWCRAAIEIGIKKFYKDIFRYKEYIEAIESNDRKNEVKLEWLIDSLEETIKLDNRDKEKAHFVRRKANSILHSGEAASQKDAFQSIKNTHYIIKRLYGTYNSNG